MTVTLEFYVDIIILWPKLLLSLILEVFNGIFSSDIEIVILYYYKHLPLFSKQVRINIENLR